MVMRFLSSKNVYRLPNCSAARPDEPLLWPPPPSGVNGDHEKWEDSGHPIESFYRSRNGLKYSTSIKLGGLTPKSRRSWGSVHSQTYRRKVTVPEHSSGSCLYSARRGRDLRSDRPCCRYWYNLQGFGSAAQISFESHWTSICEPADNFVRWIIHGKWGVVRQEQKNKRNWKEDVDERKTKKIKEETKKLVGHRAW